MPAKKTTAEPAKKNNFFDEVEVELETLEELEEALERFSVVFRKAMIEHEYVRNAYIALKAFCEENNREKWELLLKWELNKANERTEKFKENMAERLKS